MYSHIVQGFQAAGRHVITPPGGVRLPAVGGVAAGLLAAADAGRHRRRKSKRTPTALIFAWPRPPLPRAGSPPSLHGSSPRSTTSRQGSAECPVGQGAADVSRPRPAR